MLKFTLLDLIKKPIKSIEDIRRSFEILKARGMDETYYKAFYPLTRLKGLVHKMHGTKLTKYTRYIYLNPIEGVLITYKTANKFPHMPHTITHLNQITEVEFLRETKWYFSRG